MRISNYFTEQYIILTRTEEGHDEGLDRADAGIEGEGAEQLLFDVHCGSLHTQCTIFEISIIRFRLKFKIFDGQCNSFLFFISQIGIEPSTFYIR